MRSDFFRPGLSAAIAPREHNGAVSTNSRHILLLLQMLDRSFPDQVNITDFPSVGENASFFVRFWHWLADQGIVSGTPENCSLTLGGRQSINSALKQHPNSASLLSRSAEDLQEDSARELVIAVLRHHFMVYGKRQQR